MYGTAVNGDTLTRTVHDRDGIDPLTNVGCMSCSHCPHCLAVAARSTLVLHGPPGRGPTPDLAFYARFARAYRDAREQTGRPGRLLREVNPWLSTSPSENSRL